MIYGDQGIGHLLGNVTTFVFGGRDVILGQGGDDHLFGEGGRDDLFGSLGNDEIDGGDDGDLIHGHLGNDDLRGGDGAAYVLQGIGVAQQTELGWCVFAK